MLGKPEPPQGRAHLGTIALKLVQPGQSGFDAAGLAQPGKGEQYVGSHRHSTRMPCDEGAGEPLGVLEGVQCLLVTATSRLEQRPRA